MSHSSMVNSPMRFALLALISGLTAACSSQDPVDIGDGDIAYDKSSLSSYAGVWTGYVEAYTFDAGTDVVRLEINEAGSGIISIGDGEPLRVEDDPTFGITGDEALETHLVLKPELGIPYPIHNLRIESERMRFESIASAAFQDWCAAQPVYDVTLIDNPDLTAQGVPEYSCIPKGSFEPLGGQQYPRDEAGDCMLTDREGLVQECDDAGLCSVSYCVGGACTAAQQCEDDSSCLALVDSILQENAIIVPCFNLVACSEACTCDATSCRFATTDDFTPYDISVGRYPAGLLVDAVLSDDGQVLTGSIIVDTFGDGNSHTLHLTRE